MHKLYNSDFETLDSIIKSLDFNYNPDEQAEFETIEKIWSDTAGEKIAKMTRVFKFSKNILFVSCCDSYVSNELYNAKEKLLKIAAEKAEKNGTEISDIKFEYKNWKEIDK